MAIQIGRLENKIVELEREVRRLRVWRQQVGAGDLIRANALVGVVPPGSGGSGVSGSILGSVTMWENQSGATRNQGTVVVWSGNRLFSVTTTPGDLDVIGVLDDDNVAVGDDGRVRHNGYQSAVTVQGAVAVGNYLRASATAGAAEDAGASPAAGAFAIALTTAAGPGTGEVAAYLLPTELIGGVAHDPVTLAADADELLSLAGQQLGFDTQLANQVLAGPTAGGAADPDFRALVAADIPVASLYSTHHYENVPDAAFNAVVAAGDAQGKILHSGSAAETAVRLYVDAETAPGASGLPCTWQYGDTDDLDTVAVWTTIATLTLSSEKSAYTDTMTNATIPANRVIRVNWGTIVGSPANAGTTLRIKRPLVT